MLRFEILKKSIKKDLQVIFFISIFWIIIGFGLYFITSNMLSELIRILLASVVTLILILIISIPIIETTIHNRYSHVEVENRTISLVFRNGKRKSIKIEDAVKFKIYYEPEVWTPVGVGPRFGYIHIKDDKNKINLNRIDFEEEEFQKLIPVIKHQ